MNIHNEHLPGVHSFVKLSDGLCHYCWDGPLHAPTLVLIHGATVPSWEFDRIAPLLHTAGYRTLRADLYGHGYSDRPKTRYTLNLFVRQQLELINALQINNSVHVLGHSLGAAVAAQLVNLNPSRFDRVVLAAPLVNYTQTMPVTNLLKVPLLGEVITETLIVPMLVQRRSQRYRPLDNGCFVQKFKDQFIKPGFGRALLSMFRNGALDEQLPRYVNLARSGIPLLTLRGSKDNILPKAQMQRVHNALPNARHREIPDTPHSFILTHPETVAPEVISFLSAGQQQMRG